MPALRMLITRVLPDLLRKAVSRESERFGARHRWLGPATRHIQRGLQGAGDAACAGELAGPASNHPENTTCATFNDGILRAPSPEN